MTGTVTNLHLLIQHGSRPRPVREARARVGEGLEGDIHGKTRPGSRRQVLIIDQATLQAMGLGPGDLREQITVDFAALETLPAGTVLRIGGATFELTGPCEPCTHIGALNGVNDAAVFQDLLRGRRGQLARVTAVEGEGLIRLGDPVAPLVPFPPVSSR